MSTIGLIGRRPAACSLAVIQAGADPAAAISATAAAYRGHSSSSSSDTVTRSDTETGSAASRTRAAGSVEGRAIGKSNAVATSRARPRTLKQSGRFAVISKSMTASPPSRGSIEATSNPRSPILSAISSADAGMSTKSRSQDRTSRMLSGQNTSVRELLQKPEIVLVKQPDVFDLIPQDRDALDTDAPREAGVLLGVVADCLEHGGMHHAAAAYLNPAAFLAHRAAGAV